MIRQIPARMKEEWSLNGPYVMISGGILYIAAVLIAAVGIHGILETLTRLPL